MTQNSEIRRKIKTIRALDSYVLYRYAKFWSFEEFWENSLFPNNLIGKSLFFDGQRPLDVFINWYVLLKKLFEIMNYWIWYCILHLHQLCAIHDENCLIFLHKMPTFPQVPQYILGWNFVSKMSKNFFLKKFKELLLKKISTNIFSTINVWSLEDFRSKSKIFKTHFNENYSHVLLSDRFISGLIFFMCAIRMARTEFF